MKKSGREARKIQNEASHEEALTFYNKSLREAKEILANKNNLKEGEAENVADSLYDVAGHFQAEGYFHLAQKAYKETASFAESASKLIKPNSAEYGFLRRIQGHAVHYGDRVKELSKKSSRGNKLESGLSMSTAIIGILGAIFFLSPKLTGNVIGNLNSTNWVGGILFLIGLIGAFTYFKER